MPLEETVQYKKTKKSTLDKMAREGKIPAGKIEIGKNDKIIIHIPYNQDLTKKKGSIPVIRQNSRKKTTGKFLMRIVYTKT